MQTIHEDLNEYPLASCRAIVLSVALAILGIGAAILFGWIGSMVGYG